MAHRVYSAIVSAVRNRTLPEPFSRAEFRHACPGLGAGTYQAFLDKHRVENSGDATELFRRVSPGKFVCVRPFKYGLCDWRAAQQALQPTALLRS